MSSPNPDETPTVDNMPAVPAPKPEKTWWQSLPPKVRQYALVLLLWAMATAATVIAMRAGVPMPPPPGQAGGLVPAAKEEPVVQQSTEPPPDVLNFCGFKAGLLQRLMARPWPNREIKWSVDTSGYRGTVLTQQQITEAFDIAWKAWAQGLDISPVYVTDESKADVRSRFGVVYDDYGRPDGPGNILAWSELSDGTGRPRRQQYDRAEPWTISSNPGQAVIDVVRVACHEIGHAIGLVHDESGAEALMAPMYNRRIQFPTRGDFQRAITLGYPPRPVTGGGGATPVPTITIEVNANTEKLIEALRAAGFKVTYPKK